MALFVSSFSFMLTLYVKNSNVLVEFDHFPEHPSFSAHDSFLLYPSLMIQIASLLPLEG